jgi:hypothetical protein
VIELKTLTPNEILFTPIGSMLGTLDNAELEFAGAMVVRYQQLQGGDEWVPMPTEDFWEVLKTDEMTQKWSKNPFWQPNLKGLIEGGWIEGWAFGDKDCVGTVTEKFIEAVSNPRVGPEDQQAVRKWS